MATVPLPDLPLVELAVVRDRTADPGSKFLDVRSYELTTIRQGKKSAVFTYDVLHRRALDASIMVAHHEVGGRVHVWLRSAIRPPVGLRPIEPKSTPVFWEMPAGLVEPGESPHAAAVRELREELGFEVEAMEILGGWSLPAPGFIGEMHHYFHVRVDPAARKEPPGDGSPLEEGAAILAIPLDDALAACREGLVHDAKTELALRRLKDLFP